MYTFPARTPLFLGTYHLVNIERSAGLAVPSSSDTFSPPQAAETLSFLPRFTVGGASDIRTHPV